MTVVCDMNANFL